MPRIRQAVAQRVADRLFAVEAAIDEAVARAAELTAAMPQARTEARLPAMIGQDALDRATEALVTLVAARRHIVATHKALDATREQIGLREVNSGDALPKPNPTFFSAPAEGAVVARLRAVA